MDFPTQYDISNHGLHTLFGTLSLISFSFTFFGVCCYLKLQMLCCYYLLMNNHVQIALDLHLIQKERCNAQIVEKLRKVGGFMQMGAVHLIWILMAG